MVENTPAPADLVEAVTDALEPKFQPMFNGETARNIARELAQAALAAYQAHMASDGVVQADRDAAADYTRQHWLWHSPIVADMRRGSPKWDAYHLVQAFAAHRRRAAATTPQPDATEHDVFGGRTMHIPVPHGGPVDFDQDQPDPRDSNPVAFLYQTDQEEWLSKRDDDAPAADVDFKCIPLFSHSRAAAGSCQTDGGKERDAFIRLLDAADRLNGVISIRDRVAGPMQGNLILAAQNAYRVLGIGRTKPQPDPRDAEIAELRGAIRMARLEAGSHGACGGCSAIHKQLGTALAKEGK